jgi:ATP-binding cassette subfamily C (CFTR/MRP) protein 1
MYFLFQHGSRIHQSIYSIYVLAYYNRVLVMNEGKIAEFDTVLNLFDKTDSIFRSLCDEANLQRVDIVKIRNENSVVFQSSRLAIPPST